MSSVQQIEGRVALVTGANRGIGRALVDALLERGVRKVYATARRPETLVDVVAEGQGRVVPLRLDITRPDEVRQAVEEAGDVDLLVNNAGVVGHYFGGYEETAWLDAAGQEFETNVLGSLRVSQAFAPVLARNGGGAILNVISVAGLVGMPLVLSYSSTKAALHSLTQSTRLMLREQGTFVAGVYPGPVDTDMAERITMPKASARSAAEATLDGFEQGHEEIYPDSLALEFGTAYAQDPKGLELRVAAMALAD
jgi:NAD(P)-dependent dehydrogenase (short-subunit alcohol dehydrogenase family)